MKPLISEFSYGYALTEELASGRLGPLRGAPLFPSLIEEGRTGGGYDVHLPLTGIPLFLQFKLSYYMERPNASEWNSFGTPYYRMYLRPLRLSLQHQLLQTLQNQGNDVYYATPEFHTLAELNEAYINDEVFNQSAFFRPMDINLPDDREHYITFSKLSSVAWRCSENTGVKVNKISSKDLLGAFSKSVKKNGRKIDETFFVSLAANLLKILKQLGIKVDLTERKGLHMEPRQEKLKGKKLASYLARSYFETEVFIIGEEEAS